MSSAKGRPKSGVAAKVGVSENAISRELFQSLFASSKMADGRIPLSEFGARLTERYGNDQFGSLRLYYRGKRRPTLYKSWEIGEALRDCGVPWASGLWFAWACGHFADAVGIVATYMRIRGKDGQADCDAVWHMLAVARSLARATVLDRFPPFADFHLRKASFDDETGRAVAIFLASNLDRLEWLGLLLTAQDYMQREVSKSAYEPYDSMRDDMVRAFNAWLKAGGEWVVRPSADPSLDELVRAAILVAKAKSIPRLDRELATLSLYGHWLNSLESGANTALYPRGVSEKFDVTLPPGWLSDDWPAESGDAVGDDGDEEQA